jgi:formiminoglutamase
MKDISIYFSPLTPSSDATNYSEGQIGHRIERFQPEKFPTLKNTGVALFYVPEHRGDKQFKQPEGTEFFRTSFYQLNTGSDWNIPIYDLGNILPGETINDTYFAISQVVSTLVKKQLIPIIIGGSHDLTVAMYRGYEQLEQTINLCTIDYQLDLGDPEKEMHSDGFLSHLLMQRPCYLFNHANIGLQAPFASKTEIELFDKLFFDTCRLGEFNANSRIAEPYLRNSDILSIDFRSIKASELNNNNYTSPNGFYAEQLCQLTKYAGISDKLTSFGIFNYYPEKKQSTASNLVAQMIWYFIDGITQRKGDFPIGSKKNYLKFTVHLNNFENELVFYKSNKSDRWWMEVPFPPKKGVNYERHQLVPCDLSDYEDAMKNEIPNLWWKTYQKLG